MCPLPNYAQGGEPQVVSAASLIQTRTRYMSKATEQPFSHAPATAVDHWWTAREPAPCADLTCVPTGFGDSCLACDRGENLLLAIPSHSMVTTEQFEQGQSSANKDALLQDEHILAFDQFQSSVKDLLKGTDFRMAMPVNYTFDTERLAESVTDVLTQYGMGVTQHGVAKKTHSHWTTVSLTSKDGLQGDQGCTKCIPTAVWNSTQGYVHDLLEPILHSMQRVRLSNLFPGELITYHVDYGPSSPICRCHVPVTGLDKASTMIGMQRAPSDAGKMYCGDFVFPHTVHNAEGGSVRTHLMLDVKMFKKKHLARTPLGLAIVNACQDMFHQKGRKSAAHHAQKLLNHYKHQVKDPIDRAAAEKMYYSQHPTTWA